MADLTTIGYVLSILGQNQPDPADPGGAQTIAQYTALIAGASAAFVSMCNRRTIESSPFSETRNGDGSCTLILRNHPIISIDSLSINGIAQTAFAYGRGYAIADNGWAVELYGGVFTRGPRSVVVNYTAGYYPIPDDVQQAVAEMVLWKKAKMPRIDQVSISLNGVETTSYDRASMPQSVKDTIMQYMDLGGFRSA